VAGISQAPVADPSGGYHPAAPRRAGDGGSAGETAHRLSIEKAVRVIAKLPDKAGAQDGPESGEAGDDRRLGVLV
jgi:hypothetical protein